ncbi:hypothetical protein quinque_011442 [Culex quinquefasciatus]
MVLFSRLVQILVTFYCVSQTSPSNQLSISYTVSLVKQLAAEQSGIFHIWIYYFANGYHNEILQKVYDLLQNEPITRTVIDTNFDWSSSDPSIRYPSFVIICMETVQGGEPTLGKYGYLLSALRSETRIMFLLRNIEWDCGLGVKTGESQQFASYSLNLNYIYKKPTDPNEDRLDGTNAYQMNSALASWLLQRIDNWDLKTDQPRYKILRETFGMNTAFYIVPMRSVLQPTFHHIQRTLFEAGVLGLWRQQLAQNMTGGALKRGRVAAGAGVNPDAEILMFADVVPADGARMTLCSPPPYGFIAMNSV